jgi:hypothetical protein
LRKKGYYNKNVSTGKTQDNIYSPPVKHYNDVKDIYHLVMISL